MRNHVRKQTNLFPESDLFGIMPKKSTITIFAVIIRLAHNLSVLEKLNFASLFLAIQDLPTFRLSCFLFLGQFKYIYFI